MVRAVPRISCGCSWLYHGGFLGHPARHLHGLNEGPLVSQRGLRQPNTPVAAREEGAAISVPPVARSGCRDEMRWVALTSDSCPAPPKQKTNRKGDKPSF